MYLSQQLITYIGNKRALLDPIESSIVKVRDRLGGRLLRTLDVFSGSGVVSRLLKGHSSYLAANDLEDYAAAVSRCFLANQSEVDWPKVQQCVDEFNRDVSNKFPRGFIEELYSPRNEARITPRDRVFYTRENARRLDNYRRLLDTAPSIRHLLLGPLLSKASIHVNTSGVFKGFYKHNGVGRFGGRGGDALARITGKITLESPILSEHECEYEVFQQDANSISASNLDLAYIDPPYNQHPYGSNYFMLNLITNYRRPTDISRVSGIPTDWNRSGYNVKAKAKALLFELLRSLDATYLLVSFSNEGFVTPKDMRSMLGSLGSVHVVEKKYNTFRGSRNLRNRSNHVTEQLFLVERF